MRVVMTGGTSGIGFVAAKHLLTQAGVSLLIGARQPARASPDLARATKVALDLGSLAATRQFATRAAEAPIDALVLNAGLQVTKPSTSADGFELTFAANHLAHHLLIRLLLPHLAPHARVILTASGTHDPARKTAMPPPHHADADKLAFPARDPERDGNAGKSFRRAYSSSKLCNIMTMRELVRRTPDRPDLMIAAFDPGYVPATGLSRDYPAPVRWLASKIVPMISGRAHVSTPEVSGGYLAGLATDAAHASSRGTYWSVVDRKMVVEEPSRLARDDAACARLWDDSVRFTGEA